MNLTSISDLNNNMKAAIFDKAEWLSEQDSFHLPQLLQNKIVSLLFLQPSTRTRLGFASAVHKLGGRIIDVADVNVTRSVDYCAESSFDLLSVAASYSDCIVIRHFEELGRSDLEHPVPIISAGFGSSEHPTQALADVWTLHREGVSFNSLRFGFLGFIGTRVFRSLLKCLIDLGVSSFNFVSPLSGDFEGSRIASTISDFPSDIKTLLVQAQADCHFFDNADELLRDSDVVEVHPLKIPDLRKPPSEISSFVFQTPAHLTITPDLLKRSNNRCWIMHPGPRSDELDPRTDNHERSLFLKQVRNSLYIRQAVLLHCLRV